MSNYSSLKSAIDANIKANGRREITGPVLNAILNAVVNSLGDGYLFRGVAIPSTNPGTPDQNVAYLAITEGTYTHMGGLSVTDGELSVFSYNGAWSKIPLALVPTKTSQLDNDLRFVTSEEMGESLSSKQDTIQDLSEIRSGASAGATAYQKPSAGIPASDMTDTVQQAISFAESTEKRSYNSSNPDGMGYLVLKKNKTFAEQVTEANTIYEIRYDFNLGGAPVPIPAGCVLKFVGGSLSTGTITGSTTIISGTPSFADVAFAGTFDLRYIDAKWFDYTDSAEKIDAIFTLAASVKAGDVIVNLEQNATYDVNYVLHTSNTITSAKWSFDSVNNIIINGNGATLHHINPVSDFPSDSTLDGILLFYNCRNVIVTGLKYISDVGTQVYTSPDSPKGCTFIKIQGYGYNYNIDIETEYAAYAVNQHLFPLSALERVGIIAGSRFHIVANKTRYGFSSSWIEDCDIYVHSEGNHRTCYLSGASRCKVRVETAETYVSPYPCLLQQSRVLDEGGNVQYLFNSDIDISVTYVGSGNNPSTIYLVGFGNYGKSVWGDITRPAIHSKNIRISVSIPVAATNVIGVAMLYSDGTDYIAAADTFDNISVCVDCFSNATTGFYWISPNDIAFNNFVVILVNGRSNLYCGKLTKITFKDSSISILNLAAADIILDNSRVAQTNLLLSSQGNQNNTKKVRYINGGGMTAISGAGTGGKITFKLGDYPKREYWQVSANIASDSDNIILITNTGEARIWSGSAWLNLVGKAPLPTSGSTSSRPTSSLYVGFIYFDTTLGKSIVWNGSTWVNMDGSALS